MSIDIAALVAESHATVEALISDGADPEAKFEIEHHLASNDFSKLEKAAVELVKVGYHVDDADEFELDDQSTIFAFVAVSRVVLDADILEQQTRQVANIAQQAGVEYDGWGTYFGALDDEEE
ncbi:ribonuclease E inhibitor RraB [Pseudidiomarina taiwanensis]|uniref:Ribonuclease E inhibitor RraB n=1 Tax=Pseudidiomarina taiwanensis TaxID=337250 RepID=A0A432ZM81_9GAMM|nr:ribonuclease E inhibitor RraB [Pseudidiomarina taiwanensis]RUO78989.1 ribonuclease E inhibitor RraB [Pseudidiomarina taiwanensis]